MSATGGIQAVWAWLATPVAFALGVAVGLALLLGRALLHGDPDPFNDGWPIYLQATSFAGALAVTLLARRPLATAVGLYCGLVGYLLVIGASEYPMSSVIALAVHGLAPASIGALIGSILLANTLGKP